MPETKLKNSKARCIRDGFKLFYHGVSRRRNGVEVILTDQCVNVKRVPDRVMSMKL